MKNSVVREIDFKGTKVKIVRGDITEEVTEAIVNAANSHLKHGGGVAGAIVRKGGDIIQKESDDIGFVSVGKAAITSAGNLKANFVIHTVGPRWGEGDEDNKLSSAVFSALELAKAKGIKSIAFPAISTGIFGFPKEKGAEIILKTIKEFILNYNKSFDEIRCTNIDKKTTDIFNNKIGKIFKEE
jgi:O-acetyl-ADP-ribose deacetylase (regulator of RNase III)